MHIAKHFNTLGGTLKQSGRPYYCTLLGEQHLPAVMKLQADVFAALKPHEKNYILPKSAAALTGFLNGEKGQMVGMMAGGQLVAQGMLYYPQDQGAQSGMTDCPGWPEAPEKAGVVMGTIVHPASRGNHLYQKMHSALCDLAALQGRPDVMGETVAQNTYSWPGIFAVGGFIVSTGEDKSDGCQLFNYRFSDPHHPVLTGEPSLALCPKTQFNEIGALLNEGKMIGIGITPDTKLLLSPHDGWQPKTAAHPKKSLIHLLAGAA